MFAARRDQENLIHGPQKTVKPQNKPGLNCPSTPSCRNDENAIGPLTIRAAAAKSGGLGLTEREKLRLDNKGHRATPIEEPQTRAPLGIKTTNARTRACRTFGVKEIVNEIEKSQAKQSVPRRPPRQKRASTRTHNPIRQDPYKSTKSVEYAPNLEDPLPYASDVMPEGSSNDGDAKRPGMANAIFEDLRIDPTIASEVVDNEADRLAWNQEDDTEDGAPGLARPASSLAGDTRVGRRPRPRNQLSMTVSRRAASALAILPSEVSKPAAKAAPVRRPLSSLITGGKKVMATQTAREASTGNFAGEVASRTTFGYNQGRMAGSMVRSRSAGVQKRNQAPTIGPLVSRDPEESLRTSNRQLQDAPRKERCVSEHRARPRLAHIFGEVFEDDVMPERDPLFSSDDEGDMMRPRFMS
ncbi:hypothetical protein CDD81_3754 [Ophiocordyceps australis]|uniref:Uncharacterized protein n=1 Tax=Ophiocordyceps australis TaxID=1399860 RepID=A0A2C5Y862_9HYPO|nr:hypothetical protein CDD81_3754 [Ophiocordyceps australis]